MSKKKSYNDLKNGLPVAQGDILFLRVERKGSTINFDGKAINIDKSIPPEKGRLIVGHSETGHHHYMPVMERPGVDSLAQLFGTSDPMVTLLSVKEETPLLHDRAWDTHGTLDFPAGDYVVVKQRERRIDQWVPTRD